ncbi:MAG: hypothetical protein ACKOB8_02565 [Mycobacterium sp.]
MEIRDARKHGIAEADMVHAVRFHQRRIEQEYDGEVRLLYIGPGRTGDLLEIVVIPGEPSRLIHADRLRPKFRKYLG